MKAKSQPNRYLAQQQALMRLTKSENLAGACLESALKEICVTAAEVIEIERVSIWFFIEDRSAIQCQNLFQLSQQSHSRGLLLKRADYPNYFKALEDQRTIVADRAQIHPSTRDFTVNYLMPLGITSMLDAPIRIAGELIGIVCHEHVGKPRHFRVDEQLFAASMADMVAIAVEAKERTKAQSALKQAHDELEVRVAERTQRLRNAHAQLLHSEKLGAVGRLSASIAHEINNPLFGIRNVLERIHERISLDKESRDLVRMAMGECQRISGFIRKLQELHRPSSGIAVAMDLHAAIQDILLLCQKRLKSRRIRVETDFDPTLPNISAIVDQIKQVLLNLISNAEEAIETEGGLITITTRNTPLGIRLEITDTGVGISAKHLPEVFEPFFSTKAASGSGLGLSICQEIIARHGGRISVISKLHQGSCFTIELPIVGGAHAQVTTAVS